MDTYKISLAQMRISLGDLNKNLNTAKTFIKEASDQGSKLVLLPELWSTGYLLERSSLDSERNIEILKEISNTAKELNIQVCGSLLHMMNQRVYNTFFFIQENGSVLPVYHKIHLFPLMDEDKWLEKGNTIGIIDVGGIRAGVAICYDLRFPELFRKYSSQGVSLFLIVAEWPLSRTYHWQTLLKARAIENQTYVAAVNSVLQTGHEVFAGTSMIINPLGEIIRQGDSQSEQLITGEIQPQEVHEIREKYPFLKDRRTDLFPE